MRGSASAMKHTTYTLLLLLALLPNPAISTEAATSTPPPSPTSTPPPPPPTTSTPPLPTTSTPPPSPSTPPSTPPSSTTPPPSTETQPLLPQSTPSPQPTTTSPSPPSPTSSMVEDNTEVYTLIYPELSISSRPPPDVPGRSTCPEGDQIHCGTSDRCTRIRYICDGDNDCGDNSDEESALCRVWRQPDCDRNLARCTRLGRTDCITISNYCQQDNPPCEGNLDLRLCSMLRAGKLTPINNIILTTTPPPTTPLPSTHQPLHEIEADWVNTFERHLSLTISHPDCPQLYTRVGNLCLSVFFIGNMTWLESRAFCKAIGGDLFTIGSDIGPFTTIMQHFANNGVAADFWLGGRFVNATAGWQWIDDTPIIMGSPYWAVRYQEECSIRTVPYMENRTTVANDGACYNYVQSPPENSSGHCVAATYRHYWYLSDENCFIKKSPLCVMPGEKKKQAI